MSSVCERTEEVLSVVFVEHEPVCPLAVRLGATPVLLCSLGPDDHASAETCVLVLETEVGKPELVKAGSQETAIGIPQRSLCTSPLNSSPGVHTM